MAVPARSTAYAAGAARPVTPVAIAARELARLVQQAEAGSVGSGLGQEWLAQLRECRDLVAGIDPYLERCTTPESPDLQALARHTREVDWATGPGAGHLEQEMLSGHVEGQLLKMLIHLTRAQRVLEIGMFTGYSALAMAEALGPDGRVVACEIDEYVAGIARECLSASQAGHKVSVRMGPALETLAQAARAGERFDLVFVDADKGGYSGYLNAVLELDLLSPHGVVCVDNTLMQGQPYLDRSPTPNGEDIAAFNREVAGDPRVEQVLVPLRDGLTLIRRVDR
ncbi:class I SAM-dependent methyltransferase [Allobranchiibius sp. CTAmp26]|uniref:O-methyltransferase n=1 Tax=Allobranchiibius sp. CTAmp26 TaxID=2815214 RepID=UPI001AA1956E|nr:class I SAM-dependent methyltransferase [Allobranchiibius sp. CTAmp26]MBO1755466.1 class I SAM-dependent methyltransferase [Allobranchiibius sp. CTAmp26]